MPHSLIDNVIYSVCCSHLGPAVLLASPFIYWTKYSGDIQFRIYITRARFYGLIKQQDRSLAPPFNIAERHLADLSALPLKTGSNYLDLLPPVFAFNFYRPRLFARFPLVRRLTDPFPKMHLPAHQIYYKRF